MAEPLSDERLQEIRESQEWSDMPRDDIQELLDEIDRLKQSQPQYRERPTAPGKWLFVSEEFGDVTHIVTQEEIDAGGEYGADCVYGPIPQESGE